MVLTTLTVIPALAVLALMAAQPLFELWDARASEREARGAHDPGRHAGPSPAVRWHAGATVAARPGDVDPRIRIPAQRRPRDIPAPH